MKLFVTVSCSLSLTTLFFARVFFVLVFFLPLIVVVVVVVVFVHKRSVCVAVSFAKKL